MNQQSDAHVHAYRWSCIYAALRFDRNAPDFSSWFAIGDELV